MERGLVQKSSSHKTQIHSLLLQTLVMNILHRPPLCNLHPTFIYPPLSWVIHFYPFTSAHLLCRDILPFHLLPAILYLSVSAISTLCSSRVIQATSAADNSRIIYLLFLLILHSIFLLLYPSICLYDCSFCPLSSCFFHFCH